MSENRSQFIRDKIRTAVIDANKKGGIDWTRDSPEIQAAQDELSEAQHKYADGSYEIEAVRFAYKAWIDLQRTGVLF